MGLPEWFRFRRFAHDDERLPDALAGFDLAAVRILLLRAADFAAVRNTL